jgi:hypothetical protein
MSNDRFLLIKAFGWGFWADMDHLMGQLLAAELSGRIPIVYWGTNSLYSDTNGTNAFELYYEPVTAYSINDLLRPDYTFYPPIWSYKNITTEDLDKTTYVYRNLGDLMKSDVNVVVSDVHYFARPIMEFMKKDHWAYGMTPLQVFRCLICKYLKLKPDILTEIGQFYNTFLKDNTPVLAVHIRGTDKVQEVANLASLNKRYRKEIERYLQLYGVKKIFFLTDTKSILDQYKRLYGDMLVSTESNRGVDKDTAVQLDNYMNRRRKGIEVLKDTYLAARSDYFIGNGYSNVSFAVNRLKDWPESHITLFYNTLQLDRNFAMKRTKVEWLRRRNTLQEHSLNYPELYGGAEN